jgi:hypothetical protein
MRAGLRRSLADGHVPAKQIGEAVVDAAILERHVLDRLADPSERSGRGGASAGACWRQRWQTPIRWIHDQGRPGLEVAIGQPVLAVAARGSQAARTSVGQQGEGQTVAESRPRPRDRTGSWRGSPAPPAPRPTAAVCRRIASASRAAWRGCSPTPLRDPDGRLPFAGRSMRSFERPVPEPSAECWRRGRARSARGQLRCSIRVLPASCRCYLTTRRPSTRVAVAGSFRSVRQVGWV